MLCPTCQTKMDLYHGNRERHYVCPVCQTWEEYVDPAKPNPIFHQPPPNPR